MNTEILSFPQQKADKEKAIEAQKTARKLDKIKFNWGLLPIVVMDAINVYMKAHGISLYEIVPTQVISEAIAAAGYDVDDFVDNSDRNENTSNIQMLEYEISQMPSQENYKLSQVSDLNAELRQINRKLDRKYPGMSERYRNRVN